MRARDGVRGGDGGHWWEKRTSWSGRQARSPPATPVKFSFLSANEN